MSERVRVRARFESLQDLEHALAALKERGMRHYEAFGPVNLKSLEDLMPVKGSPVRIWATGGALFGLFSFWFMCVASSLIYHLVVGGKPPWSNVPFVVVMYEGTILMGSILAFLSGIAIAGLWPRKPPSTYDPRFSDANFGLEVDCSKDEEGQILELLRASGVKEIYER